MPAPFSSTTTQSHPRLRPLTRLAIFSASLVAAAPATAIDYGILDARALSMGGTVVAVGNTAQAQYYNPALMAFHNGDEDETRDGRVYLPTLVAQTTDTLIAAASAVDDQLDSKLSSAITAYNATHAASAAGAISTSASELRDVLNKIANKNLALDGFVGLSVSEPSDHEGGAFYMGARVIGVGTSTITADDLNLLDKYINATDELAKGASPVAVAAKYQGLVNANGSLNDPVKALGSSADVSALAIGEWGMAAAKEFNFWGQAVSLGITPKLMRLDAYRDKADFNNTVATSVNDTINQFSDTRSTHITFNADLGVAAIIAEHYRIGLAVKDAVAQDFTTHQGKDATTGLLLPDLEIKLHPRSRLGLGYVTENLSIGLDYDLKQSTPMATEAPSQNLCLGAEYRLFDSLALRAGYRHDQTGLQSNVSSLGVGYRWRRLVADIGYATSSELKGGSLQLGWTF